MKRLEGGESAYPWNCPNKPIEKGQKVTENDPCEVSEAVNIRREEKRWFVPLREKACGCIVRRWDIRVPENPPKK